MSDEGPTITVTRGTREDAPERTSSSSRDRPRSSSGGLGVPGPTTLVSGMIRGARNVWWAGLGILAVARDASSQVFDALVEEGRSWEQARREQARERARQVQQLAEEGEALEAVEERVREEVDAVLRRIGVPRREDLDALHKQVDALHEEVERLAQSFDEAGSS